MHNKYKKNTKNITARYNTFKTHLKYSHSRVEGLHKNKSMPLLLSNKRGKQTQLSNNTFSQFAGGSGSGDGSSNSNMNGKKWMKKSYQESKDEAIKTIDKYKTPDACKNEQELNELEDARNFIIQDEMLHNAAVRTCEEDS